MWSLSTSKQCTRQMAMISVIKGISSDNVIGRHLTGKKVKYVLTFEMYLDINYISKINGFSSTCLPPQLLKHISYYPCMQCEY